MMRILPGGRSCLGCFNGHHSMGIPSHCAAANFHLSILVNRGTFCGSSNLTQSLPSHNTLDHMALLSNGSTKSSSSSLKRAKASLDLKNLFASSRFEGILC